MGGGSEADGSVARLASIHDRIAKAARSVGRDPSDINLIGVTKTFGEDSIRAVLDDGHRSFGENRVQEAAGKWPALRGAFPDIELHLIGPLQSNKSREAVALFDVIHTVDREKIARALADEMARSGRTPTLFVQVNTGEEAQKAGVFPNEAIEFVKMCKESLGLLIAGLMCIPPVDEEPALHFALLAKLAEDCGVGGLSMGMSGDFETAVQFGATHVRVGSAIFGER